MKEIQMTKYNYFLQIADIMFFASLVMFALCAVFTNALVVKDNPTTQIFEINPANAEAMGYSLHPNWVQEVLQLIKMVLLPLSIGCIYWAFRVMEMSRAKFVYFMGVVTFVFIITLFNFANDYGYFLGKIMFGG